MKLVTINNALLLKYSGDSEVLQKSTRPYVLVVRLKYKNTNYDFAVPIRSNIPASAPKDQYFALPPRPQTRPKNRHGLHYIKMFPVTKQYLVRYRVEGNNFATVIQNMASRNGMNVVSIISGIGAPQNISSQLVMMPLTWCTSSFSNEMKIVPFFRCRSIINFPGLVASNSG